MSRKRRNDSTAFRSQEALTAMLSIRRQYPIRQSVSWPPFHSMENRLRYWEIIQHITLPQTFTICLANGSEEKVRLKVPNMLHKFTEKE